MAEERVSRCLPAAVAVAVLLSLYTASLHCCRATCCSRCAIAAVHSACCLPRGCVASLHTSTAATLCVRAWVCCQQRHPGVSQRGLVLAFARGAAAHLLSVRMCRLRALLSWDLSCVSVCVCICVLIELHPCSATPYMRGVQCKTLCVKPPQRVCRHMGQPLFGLAWGQAGRVCGHLSVHRARHFGCVCVRRRRQRFLLWGFGE
jgi:hypothetical protein